MASGAQKLPLPNSALSNCLSASRSKGRGVDANKPRVGRPTSPFSRVVLAPPRAASACASSPLPGRGHVSTGRGGGRSAAGGGGGVWRAVQRWAAGTNGGAGAGGKSSVRRARGGKGAGQRGRSSRGAGGSRAGRRDVRRARGGEAWRPREGGGGKAWGRDCATGTLNAGRCGGWGDRAECALGRGVGEGARGP